jgi:hypothetical protein
MSDMRMKMKAHFDIPAPKILQADLGVPAIGTPEYIAWRDAQRGISSKTALRTAFEESVPLIPKALSEDFIRERDESRARAAAAMAN